MNEILRFSNMMIICMVLLSYIFFGVSGAKSHTADRLPKNYQALTEGFLLGQVSLPFLPPEKLIQLKNPYDFMENYSIQFPDGEILHQKVHDASYYKGKFYLYFGPLPVFLFYLPCKLLLGYYLEDYVAIILFLSVGFIFCYSLLIKIKNTYFSYLSDFQLMFAGLVLGIVNNAPFLCSRAAFYEVAIASAFLMLSAALFFLYRIFHNHCRVRDLALFSLCLGLSASGRPHFALLSFILIPGLLLYLYKYTDKKHLFFQSLALCLPVALIGLALMLYNYVRFDSIFEFGQSYLLVGARHGLPNNIFILKDSVFNLIYGFYNYFLRSFDLINSFPYVFFPDFYTERVMHSNTYESTIGLLKTAPSLTFIAFLPVVIKEWYSHQNHFYRPILYFVNFLALITFAIVLIILSVTASNQRYLSDFSTFLIMLSIISFWAFDNCVTKDIYQFFQYVFVFLGMIGIYISMTMGNYYVFQWYYFAGYNFSTINEVLFLMFSFCVLLFYLAFTRRLLK